MELLDDNLKGAELVNKIHGTLSHLLSVTNMLMVNGQLKQQ